MRERLPDRRPCETFEFDHRGIAYTASIGLYPDGRIAEAFIDGPKAGTDLQIAAKDSAVAVSIALQHGASVDELRHAMGRGGNGKPQGVIGALLDLMAAVGRDAGGADV